MFTNILFYKKAPFFLFPISFILIFSLHTCFYRSCMVLLCLFHVFLYFSKTSTHLAYSFSFFLTFVCFFLVLFSVHFLSIATLFSNIFYIDFPPIFSAFSFLIFVFLNFYFFFLLFYIYHILVISSVIFFLFLLFFSIAYFNFFLYIIFSFFIYLFFDYLIFSSLFVPIFLSF